MQHLISVIMPAYNAGKYLGESIESVRQQTYAGWELVVVDDGSTDNTSQIAQRYVDADPRVRLFFQSNGGQASARNKALREARGELVAFLDSDDLWLPEKLQSQLAVMDTRKVDLVYSDGIMFSDDAPELPDKFFIVPGETRGLEMFKLLFAANRIATLSVLVNRKSLDAVGLFDEDRTYQNSEDYDLWLKLAKNGSTFYGMTEKLMRYRRHSASTTFQASRLLTPMLAVVLKHSSHPSLDAALVRRRVRSLYRELISALVVEGKIDEAREQMREFCKLDGGALVTKFQQTLLRLFPRQYNYISRECLYRAEWHVQSLLNRPHALVA